MGKHGRCKAMASKGGLPFVAAVYSIEQCYGGPEEGGWWYDNFIPHSEDGKFILMACGSEEAALNAMETLKKKWKPTGRGHSCRPGFDPRIFITKGTPRYIDTYHPYC